MVGDVKFKICGLKESRHVEAAAAAGAGYLGFVFFEKSPRNVTIKQARELVRAVPAGLAKVALSVDADNAKLDAIVDSVGVDILQLHGHESPERVSEIRDRFGLPVMKVIGVANETDLEPLAEYCRVADQLLIDAKAPKGAPLPGGNGLAFDWRLIAGRRWPVPWMLAGGLNAENVAEAIALTGANQIDVSSGVESSPGVKRTNKINAFARALQSN